MNIKQAFELGQKAKKHGYCVRVKNGMVQFVTVKYDSFGISTVTKHTDWISFDEALEIIEGSQNEVN